MRINLESLLNCSVAELRPLNSVGHWFYTTNSSTPPPQVSLCVSDSPSHHHHDHTVTLFCPRRHTTHSPTFYARRHAVQKTSEVGANPESRLTLSTHQLFAFTVPLSYSSRWWGGLWEPTASCIRSLIKKVFRKPTVPDAFSQSPAYIYHQTNDPFKHSKGRSAGVDRWNIVYAFRMYSSTVIVRRAILFLILTPMFFFSFLWPLCKAVYCIWCVYF